MYLLVIIAISSTRWVTVPSVTTAEIAGYSMCEDAKTTLLKNSTVIKEAFCVKLER
jgi:hypothetical protein